MWKRSQSAPVDPWEAAARVLGLSWLPERNRIVGATREFQIAIVRGAGGNEAIEIQLDLAQTLLAEMGEPGLFIERRGANASAQGISTGDALFDARVILRGREDLLSACMSAEGRRRVLAFAERGGTLQSGIFRLHANEDHPVPVLTLSMLALEAAEAFLVDDLPRALEKNAAVDPLISVRLRNLELLARNHPNSAACEWAVPAALRDPSPEMVLFGANILGAASWGPLVELLESSRTEPSIRCAVLEQLLDDRENAGTAHVLLTALRADEPRLRYAGVIAFARLAEQSQEIAADESLRTALFTAMTPALKAELAKGVAIALGNSDDARAEPLLISFLRHELREVRIWAASSLAVVGTANAVEPLLELARGGPLNRRANLAALLAVRAIQERIGEVDEGLFSLAPGDADAGSFSLAAEPGAISLPSDEPDPR